MAETDFFGGVPSWITRPDYSPVNVVGTLGGYSFLGPFEGDIFGTEIVRFTVDFAEGTTHGVVTFDFNALDTRNNSVTWGPNESLVVHISDQPAFSVLGVGLQTPSGSFDGGPSVTIGWGSTTNQPIFDESFGIDNFRAVSLTEGSGSDANPILGGIGADLIFGGEGNDSLFGGWGRDVLEGGAGDDLSVTGTGGFPLTGNAERDTIVPTRGGGTDTVQDFETRKIRVTTGDRIDISQLRGGHRLSNRPPRVSNPNRKRNRSGEHIAISGI